jgi:hypothetical protein
VLEKHRVKYTLVAPADLEKPKFLDNFDALRLPTPLGARRWGGAPAGLDAQMPPTDQLIAGDAQGRGPSDSGTTDAVQKFVRDGGTVIALNQASNSLITALDLPIRDVTSGLSRNDFYVPGSILGAEVDANNPLSNGVDGTASLWVENSPAFEITGVKPGVWVNVVARYLPTIDPLESGWLLGGEKLRGKAALIEARIGKGRAVLFGFEPNYRGIALGTYPLLFNSISSSVRK